MAPRADSSETPIETPIEQATPVRSVARRRRLMGRQAPQSTGARAPKNKEHRRRIANLEGEVRRRDEEIAALKAGRCADREALDRARGELEEMRRIYEADMRLNAKRSETLRLENAGLRAETEVLTRDFNAEAVIERYADVMKSKGSSTDSEYASRLQSELCKAAHQVEVLSDQVKVVKKTCSEKVESLGEELAQMVHERGQREANLMKEKRALHNAKRLEVEAYEKELIQKQSTIVNLEEKLEETLAHANNQSAFAFDTSSAADSSLALSAFKQQLDVLSLEKEAVEHDLKQKLKCRDETIALLQEVNAANDNHLEMLRADLEKSKKEEKLDENGTRVSARKDQSAASILGLMSSLSKVTGSLEGDVQASLQRKRMLIDSLGNGDFDDQDSALPDAELEENSTRESARKDQSAASILGLMSSLSKVTGSLEGDVQASLQRKRMLIDSLGNEDIDDQVSALPDVVEWNAAKSVTGGMQPLVREPSMLSVISDIA